MAVRVRPYKQGSRSARTLAAALGGRVLKLVGSRWRARPGDTVINWGSSQNINYPCRVLNSPNAVGLAANKLLTFNKFKEDVEAGVMAQFYPDFTTDREVAQGWIEDNEMVVVRNKLSGHSGEGIEIIKAGEHLELPLAPLYVKYVKKQDEFRVHIMADEVILVQRKARRTDVETPNWQVRNHANGFVFARNNVAPNDSVIDVARLAVRALGLDFGAVDVIWNNYQQKAYVLEVNTACGMEGSTGEDYAAAFRRHYGPF